MIKRAHGEGPDSLRAAWTEGPRHAGPASVKRCILRPTTPLYSYCLRISPTAQLPAGVWKASLVNDG